LGILFKSLNSFDIKKWNQKFDFIIKTEVPENILVNNDFRWATTKMKIKSKLLIIESRKQLCWVGSKYGVKVYHNWIFQPISEDKTLLISEESQQGFFAFLFKKKFIKSVKTGAEKWLNQIKQNAEKNEIN
jgi:hypothetical protein